MKISSNKALFIIVFCVLIVVSLAITREVQFSKPIIFDHGLHVVDNEMSCDECHEGIGSAPAKTRAIPDHDVCASCHDVENEGDCGTCHLDSGNPTAIQERSTSYAGFAHQNHSKLTCEKCHSAISAVGVDPIVPMMNDCQSCHTAQMGPLECESCHQGKRPLPNDHQLVSWKEDHGLEAGDSETSCASCHNQTSCDDCHQGINLTGTPHPPTWKFNHFAESAFGGDCMTCHETRETCTSCHRSMVKTPHPLGSLSFANKTNGGDHVKEAESFIEVCISCHDVGNADPTCNKCHD